MRVERSIEVSVPVRTAYDQWTQFEDFPRFMSGVSSVQQLDDEHLRWVAEIAGVRREWTATILEQVPDEKVAWAAVEGATNAGAVHFQAAGPAVTSVRLVLEYEPEGLVEKAGDALHLVERQVEGDLERFKAFMEDAGAATGAWRGTVGEGAGVGTPGVEAAAGSEGDRGKAGVSGKAVIAGAAAAAVGVAAASALAGRSGAEATPVEGASAEPDAMISREAEAALVAETVEPDLAATTAGRPDDPAAPVDLPLADTSVVDPAEGSL
jgi:carbon monoxide dehydrogenase subunit G